MYFIYGMLYGYNIIKVPYTSLQFPTEKFLNSISKDSIVIVSNPSSPIADVLSKEFLSKLQSKGIPILIDEAYIEFSDEKTVLPWIKSYNNLFVTRTFSKAYGSAGVRLGIISSQKENIDLILQYRPMYEVNGLTVKWIQTLLNNLHEVETYIKNVKKTKDEVIQLCKSSNIEVVTGHSNWIHIRYKNQLPDGIFKTNCYLPGLGSDWIRLQITDNIKDYLWIK
jgi:histidinol-phosphate aminotransferase